MDKKKTKKNILTFRRVWIVVGACTLPFLVQGTWNMYQSFLRSEAEAEKAQREYESLVARRESVEAQLDAISTRSGMEREIRQRFDVGKPGEELLVVVDRKKPEEDITPIPQPWWKRYTEKARAFYTK